MKIYEDKVSSAAARVRIALALKGLSLERENVSILGPDAKSHSREYRQVNPQGLVPALMTDEGNLLTQSLAIVEYLDERYPVPALLPLDRVERAHARSIALTIAAEIHALVPPRVAARLGKLPGFEPTAFADWARHWVSEGLTAVEALLARRPESKFATGSDPPSPTFSCFRKSSMRNVPAMISANGLVSPPSWRNCVRCLSLSTIFKCLAPEKSTVPSCPIAWTASHNAYAIAIDVIRPQQAEMAAI